MRLFGRPRSATFPVWRKQKKASFRKPLFVSECQSYYRNDCLDLLAQTVPTMYFFVFRGNGCAGCPKGVLPVACFPLNVRCF